MKLNNDVVPGPVSASPPGSPYPRKTMDPRLRRFDSEMRERAPPEPVVLCCANFLLRQNAAEFGRKVARRAVSRHIRAWHLSETDVLEAAALQYVVNEEFCYSSQWKHQPGHAQPVPSTDTTQEVAQLLSGRDWCRPSARGAKKPQHCWQVSGKRGPNSRPCRAARSETSFIHPPRSS